MYIGSTDVRGLHHLVWEVVDNSIDEAMAGYATTIDVTIHADGMVDGRSTTAAASRSASTRRARTRSRSSRPCCTPAASSAAAATRSPAACTASASAWSTRCREWMRVESARDGSVWAQEYARGKPHDPVKKLGPAGRPARHDDRCSGPTPRSSRRSTTRSRRSRSASARRPTSTKGVWITLIDERDRPRAVVLLRGRHRVVRAAPEPEQGGPPRAADLRRAQREGTTTVEVALQYNDTYTENVLAFANNINTVDGGTHVTGFRAALTRTLNDYARKAGILKDADANLTGDDVREGLTAVISVKLPNPQFEGQTKAKLGNAEVKGQVQTVARRGARPVPRGEPRRRPPDHREVPDRGPRPRGGAQGARPGASARARSTG